MRYIITILFVVGCGSASDADLFAQPVEVVLPDSGVSDVEASEASESSNDSWVAECRDGEVVLCGDGCKRSCQHGEFGACVCGADWVNTAGFGGPGEACSLDEDCADLWAHLDALKMSEVEAGCFGSVCTVSCDGERNELACVSLGGSCQAGRCEF